MYRGVLWIDMLQMKGLNMDNSTGEKKTFVPSDLYEILAKIATTHQITQTDRSLLKKVFLEEQLTEEEHLLVNRLHRAVMKGRITLV